MHNCKSARSNFVELAVNELQPAEAQRLLAELNECGECRAEYAAMTSALHVSSQALRSTEPSEKFWTGYNSRLQERLLAASDTRNQQPSGYSTTSVWIAIRSFAESSVRLRMP